MAITLAGLRVNGVRVATHPNRVRVATNINPNLRVDGVAEPAREVTLLERLPRVVVILDHDGSAARLLQASGLARGQVDTGAVRLPRGRVSAEAVVAVQAALVVRPVGVPERIVRVRHLVRGWGWG